MKYARDFRSLAAMILVLLVMPAVSRAQSANDGYDPNANNTVAALVVQPDGKTLVGGSFTTITGQTRNRLARLNADGSLDTGFVAIDLDNTVIAIAVQADGRIVVAGNFTQVGSYVRQHIARLNADGSVDAAFDPIANDNVRAIAVQPDGKLVVGGLFTSLSPNGGSAIPRKFIARLNADGSVDPAFDPSANNYVLKLALQADGKLVLGGFFHALSPNGGSTITRNYIARLNVNGTVDTAFDPNPGNPVRALALQPDGRMVLGGEFTSLSPNGGASISRNRIARVNTDGSVDAAFNPTANGDVIALARQADGKLVMGGQFTTLSPNGGAANTRNYVARLNVDGSLDMAFNPNANNFVQALAQQPDGKLLLGGGFSSLSPNGGSAITRNSIARLNGDGSVDAAFMPNANDQVTALALQPDGKLVLGGRFTSLSPNAGSAVARNRIARLNADGSLDASFNPNANNDVTAVLLQPDGKLVVSGNFTSLSPNGGSAITRNGIARLNADGSVDLGFDPNATNPTSVAGVYALALQPDGKLVIGGGFTRLSPNGGSAITRNYVARLNTDGSLDAAFDPNASSVVFAVAVQPDGKLVIGGGFESLSPNGGANIVRTHLARLNSDGSVDTAFNQNTDYIGRPVALALQPDGKLLLAGGFASLSPNPGGGGIGAITRNGLARLNADGSVDTSYDPRPDDIAISLALQPDGKLVVGGYFTSFSPNGGSAVPRGRIARLNGDGSVDTTLDWNANNAVVALALQPDGLIVAGGGFTLMNALPRDHIARLSSPQAALQSLGLVTYTAGNSATTWQRTGAGPELAPALNPQLLFSLTDSNFVAVGPMHRSSNGWLYSGFVPPLNQNFYLRTRALIASGIYGSGSLIETTRQFYLSSTGDKEGIFADEF